MLIRGHPSNAGAIASGVGGGMVLIFILVAAFFFYRRRRHCIRSAHKSRSATKVHPKAMVHIDFTQDKHTFEKAPSILAEICTLFPRRQGAEGRPSSRTLVQHTLLQ